MQECSTVTVKSKDMLAVLYITTKKINDGCPTAYFTRKVVNAFSCNFKNVELGTKTHYLDFFRNKDSDTFIFLSIVCL